MQTTIRGKNLTVSDKDRDYIERKMQRLERMLDDRSEAEVELRLEGNRKVNDSHIVDVTLAMNGRSIRGSSSASTFKVAADDVIDKLERRTVDSRERPRDRRRAEAARYDKGAYAPPDDGASTDDGDLTDDGGPQVVKVKRFSIEPMFEEDAIARMEELGHQFFIFVDGETEQIAVLYRRKDGRYGLIEPALSGGYGSDG